MRDKLAVWATTPWRLNRLARGGCGVLLGGVPWGWRPLWPSADALSSAFTGANHLTHVLRQCLPHCQRDVKRNAAKTRSLPGLASLCFFGRGPTWRRAKPRGRCL